MRHDDVPTYRVPAYKPTITRLVCEGIAFAMIFAVCGIFYCLSSPPDAAGKANWRRAQLPFSQGR